MLPLRRAYARGLIRPAGWQRLLLGLAAAQAAIGLAHLSLVFPTRLEPPLGALLAVLVLAAAVRAARPHLHPGLRGLRRPAPRDGLELIEREQRAAAQPVLARLWPRIRGALPLLPALGLLALLMAAVPARALGLGLLALVLAAPMLLMPYRWLWVLPLGLVLPLGVLLAQALALRASLPPGWWTQPLAVCPGLVRLTESPPRAWCVDPAAGQVLALEPGFGALSLRQPVANAARLLAASGGTAWVQQNPAQGLVRVGPGGPQPVRVLSAQVGAADFEGRLWVIDVSQELTVYAPDGTAQRLFSRDGLLNNTANVVRVSPAGDVWVGSISGLSVLRRGAQAWQTIGPDAGAPGAVRAIAFGPDDRVWVLWQALPGYSGFFDWGLSALDPDGAWTHRALGQEVQLGLALVEDPLAIDGRGRAWVATHTNVLAQRVLIVAAPGQAANFYLLGSHLPTSTLWRDVFGVVPDGHGGILLYVGEAGWWRWRR